MFIQRSDSIPEDSFYVNTVETFKYNWYCWRFLGIHPTKRFTYLYYIYGTILNVMITTLYPITLVIEVFRSGSMKRLLEASNLTATNVINSCKQFNALIFRKEILRINDFIRTLDTRTNDPDQQIILQRMIKKSYRVFKTFFVLYTLTGFLSEIATIFASPRRLMYPAWFPFDWRASTFNFVVVHIYQFIGIMIGTVQEATNDTFPGIYMAVLTAHMQTLMLRIRKIGQGSRNALDENYEKLVTCVRDYQLLKQYYHLLNRITSYGLLLQFFATGIVTCITAVYVLFINGTVFDMIYLGFYFLCVLTEILISCYYGNELMYESHQLTNAIYTCNWIGQSRKFKKVLIIFMLSTQKDMVIKAGGLVVVNLESFMSVIKSSYSLFAVLIKVT